MTRTKLALAALLTAGALTGCATAPVARVPAGSGSVVPATTTAATVPSSPAGSGSRPVTASAASSAATATTPRKKFATAKLPAQVSDRRADQVALSAGGQTASYYKPMATSDVIVAALSPVGTAADAAQGMSGAKASGPATCGTLTVSGTPLAACVVPLDGGYLLVNASGTQTVAEVTAFTAAVYDALA